MNENIGKYLNAEMLPDVPGRKTHRWDILTKDGDRLGMIEWYPPWRQYTFNPFRLTTYSAGCLNDLARFLDRCKLPMNQGEPAGRTPR